MKEKDYMASLYDSFTSYAWLTIFKKFRHSSIII